MKTTESPRERSIWRAILVALPLIVANIAFATRSGLSWTAPPSTLSLFYNAVVSLLALILVNAVLKGVAPRFAFSQRELLVVYVMVSVATAIAGHDEIEIVASIAVHAFQYATPENDWQNLFWRNIPSWLSMSDARAVASQSSGDASVYDPRVFAPWLRPALWWSLFFFVVAFVGYCLSLLLRKPWMEHERLTFPVIRLPYELTVDGGSSTFFRDATMWAGFLVAASVDSVNGLHFFFPQVPLLPVRNVDLGRFVTQKPWSAIGWTPLCFFPFVIGLAYFIPKNLSLSVWVFYLIWKIQKVVLGSMGQYNVLGPFTLYYDAESLGAFLGIILFVLYSIRSHLLDVLRGLFAPGGNAETREYRFAVTGLAVGSVALTAFWVAAGMSVWLAGLLIALYLVTIVTVARLRAEVGPPSHDFYSASRALTGFLGTRAFTPRELTVIGIFRGIDRMYRGHPMPHEFEALRLSERAGISRRQLATAILIAAAVAGPVGFWAWLDATNSWGGATGSAYGGEAFRIAQNWLVYPQGPDPQAIVLAVIGFVVSVALTFAHRAFIWWPLHPVGFALAVAWNTEWFWFPILLSWLAKTLILKYGGVKAYNRASRFFLGLVLGDFTAGFAWNAWGLFTRRWIYVFWH